MNKFMMISIALFLSGCSVVPAKEKSSYQFEGGQVEGSVVVQSRPLDNIKGAKVDVSICELKGLIPLICEYVSFKTVTTDPEGKFEIRVANKGLYRFQASVCINGSVYTASRDLEVKSPKQVLAPLEVQKSSDRSCE